MLAKEGKGHRVYYGRLARPVVPNKDRYAFSKFQFCVPVGDKVLELHVLDHFALPPSLFALYACHTISRTDLASLFAASGSISPTANLASSSDPSASADSRYSSLSMSAGRESYTVIARRSSSGCQT